MKQQNITLWVSRLILSCSRFILITCHHTEKTTEHISKLREDGSEREMAVLNIRFVLKCAYTGRPQPWLQTLKILT